MCMYGLRHCDHGRFIAMLARPSPPGKARPAPACICIMFLIAAEFLLLVSWWRHAALPQPQAVHAVAACNNSHRRASWEGAIAQIKSEEDTLWTPDTREGHAEIRARGATFLRWLLVRGLMKL